MFPLNSLFNDCWYVEQNPLRWDKNERLHHSEEPKLNKPLSGENLSGMVFFIVKFDIVKFQN